MADAQRSGFGAEPRSSRGRSAAADPQLLSEIFFNISDIKNEIISKLPLLRWSRQRREDDEVFKTQSGRSNMFNSIVHSDAKRVLSSAPI